METTRQQKIERLIQKDLSAIFLKYTRALSGTLISVSEVRISPDLSIAHVYLSIFPDANAPMAMEQINQVLIMPGLLRSDRGGLSVSSPLGEWKDACGP